MTFTMGTLIVINQKAWRASMNKLFKYILKNTFLLTALPAVVKGIEITDTPLKCFDDGCDTKNFFETLQYTAIS